MRNLVGWSNLTDSAGRKVREYRLALDEGGFTEVMTKINAWGVDLLWQLFMLLSTFAATLLGIIGNPTWLESLDRGYQRLTASAFSIVNPLVLATGAFGVMMLWIFLSKSRSSTSRLDSNDMNRIASAIAMMVVIGALAANPFAILKFVLSFVQAGIAELAGTDTVAYSVFSVDAMIRQPTLIITYNGAVSDKCAEAWSKQGSLPDNGSCFEVNGDQPTALTVVLALLALGMAVTALVFAGVAAWKFIKHLTLAVIGFVSLPWVASVSMARRRQFDPISNVAVVAFGHMAMVFAVQVIALGGPALVSGLMSGWGQSGSAVLQMIALMIMYLLLTGFMVTATKKNGALMRSLRADTRTALRTYFGASVSDRIENTSIRNTFSRSLARGERIGRGVHHIMGKTAQLRRRRSVEDDLTEAQRTVNLVSGEGKTVEIAGAALTGRASSVGKELARLSAKSDQKTGARFVPSTRGVGKPLDDTNIGAVFDALVALAAAQGVASLSSVPARVAKPYTDPEILAELRKRVPGLKGLSDRNLKKLIEGVVAMQHVAGGHRPLFGGRTPQGRVTQLIQNFLIDLDININRFGPDELGGTAAPIAPRPDGGRDGGGAALTAYERYAAFQQAQQRRYSADAALLHRHGGFAVDSDGVAVQSVTSIGSGNRVSTREIKPWRPTSRSTPSERVGSPVTPGDTVESVMGLSDLTERAMDEADADALRAKLSAQGERVSVTLPEGHAHELILSPNGVTPKTGMGFGDYIGD